MLYSEKKKNKREFLRLKFLKLVYASFEKPVMGLGYEYEIEFRVDLFFYFSCIFFKAQMGIQVVDTKQLQVIFNINLVRLAFKLYRTLIYWRGMAAYKHGIGLIQIYNHFVGLEPFIDNFQIIFKRSVNWVVYMRDWNKNHLLIKNKLLFKNS